MKGGFRVGDVDASGLRIAIVAARFNEEIVSRLVRGALDALVENGAGEDDVVVHWVPGSFELPVACGGVAATGDFDAIVALGAVVRGETPHFEFVAGEAAAGIASVALEYGIPVSFGVLTTDTWEQAEARAGGDAGNKGVEAALAAVETANLLNRL